MVQKLISNDCMTFNRFVLLSRHELLFSGLFFRVHIDPCRISEPEQTARKSFIFNVPACPLLAFGLADVLGLLSLF